MSAHTCPGCTRYAARCLLYPPPPTLAPSPLNLVSRPDVPSAGSIATMVPPRSSREEALSELRAKLLQHKEVDAKVRQLRESVATAKKEFDKTEDDLKALQSVGQIIGEVLRQLDAERCECLTLRMRPHQAFLPRCMHTVY